MLGNSGSGGFALPGAGTYRWLWCGGLQEFVDEIIQLGYMPTLSKNTRIEEERLARWLIYAGKTDWLTREQEAAFDNSTQASGASQPAVASGGTARLALQELVDEIIQVGHMPTRSKNASVEEIRLARRLSRLRKAGSLTREQEATLDNLVQASGASQSASARGRPRVVKTPAAMEQLMDEISQLGHVPTMAKTASPKEKRLYSRLWRARTAGSWTKEQEAVWDKLVQASVAKVVQQVRDLGHFPKASAGRSLAERQLAWKLRTVVNAKQLSPEQEAELQALRRLSRRTDMRKRPPGGWGPDGPPQRLLELAENGRAAKARRQAAARDAA